MHSGTIQIVFVLCMSFLIASLQGTIAPAQDTNIGRTIGGALFRGEVTDSDARQMQNWVHEKMGVQDIMSKECKAYSELATSSYRDLAGGRGFNVGDLVATAEACAHSTRERGNARRVSLPPLPRFNSDVWQAKRMKWGNSFYAIKSMRNADGQYLGWSHAQRACWHDHRGRLVTIESAEEDQFIQRIVREHGSAYIGIYRRANAAADFRARMYGASKADQPPPQWMRHTAAGKDTRVVGYTNWHDSEPSREIADTFFPAHLGLWGVYDSAEPAWWQFWSERKWGWRTVHAGKLVHDPVLTAICEWDMTEWTDVTDLDQLSRHRLFNTAGGVSNLRGESFRF